MYVTCPDDTAGDDTGDVDTAQDSCSLLELLSTTYCLVEDHVAVHCSYAPSLTFNGIQESRALHSMKPTLLTERTERLSRARRALSAAFGA